MPRPQSKAEQVAKTSYGIAAVADVPDLAGSTGSTRPPIGLSEPFFLFVRPDRVAVIGGVVTYAARSLVVDPGAEGVGLRGGKPTIAAAAAHLRAAGWFMIPVDIDGPGTSYLRRVAGTNGWMTRFERRFSGSPVIESDSKAYGAWLKGLEEKGKLPPIETYAVEALVAELTKQLDTDPRSRVARPLSEALAVAQRELEGRRRELEEATSGEDVPDVDTEE